MNIARKTARPCRLSLTPRPYEKQRAAGIISSDRSSSKLENGVGFSKAFAEFAPL